MTDGTRAGEAVEVCRRADVVERVVANLAAGGARARETLGSVCSASSPRGT